MRFVFWLKGHIVSDGLYVVTDELSEYNPVAFHTSCEDELGIHVGSEMQLCHCGIYKLIVKEQHFVGLHFSS